MEICVISSGMLAVALLLCLIGSVLKYRTGTSNELIAAVLIGSSFVIWCLIGSWKAAGHYDGAAFWYEVFFANGFSLGLPTAAIPIAGWDFFHGIHKYRKNKKLMKEEEKS